MQVLKLKWIRKEKVDRLKLIQTISFLRVVENKIKFIEDRIRGNSEKRFQELVSHYSSGGDEYAKIIASEVAEQRKLANMIARMRVGVEKIRLRLETILEIGGTVELLKDISPMLKDLKKLGIQAVPEFGIMFTELQNKLADMGVEIDTTTYLPSSTPTTINAESDDVARILEEAREIASEKIGEKIPNPP